MRRTTVPAFAFLFALSLGPALADEPGEAALAEAKRRLLEQTFGEKIPQDHGGCEEVGVVSCPTVAQTGSLSSSDCHLGDGSYADTYHFSGTAGRVVTIDLTSSVIDPFVLLRAPNGTVAAFDDDSGTGLNSHLVFTLNATGTWAVVANSAFPNEFGAYNLTMTCSGGTTPGTCTPNANTLCVSNNRFRVQTTFRTPQQQTGSGNAVSLTADSGYFWFFDPGNVEIVVKVLNACIFDPHIWVFSAGLTDVEVTMTVTDTKNGSQKVYTNPLGTAYLAIQDTSAFATCP